MQNPNILNIFLNEFHAITQGMDLIEVINDLDASSPWRIIAFYDPDITESVLEVSRIWC